MLAVITTGGKQYIVSPGTKIKVEKLPQKEGEEIIFDQVLLLETDANSEVGKPFVRGASVKAKVLTHGKGEKLVVFKYKAKKREKKKKGHRQPFTQVEIMEISKA